MRQALLTTHAWLQISIYVVLLAAVTKPLGSYIVRIYNGQYNWLNFIFSPFEHFCYKTAGIFPDREMTWQQYAKAILSCSLWGWFILFCILKFQGHLPINPQHFPNLSADLAFNIAASFVTNTNWQSYAGESTLSYFSQMIGLTVQNFISASMGMAVAVAFIRGLKRQNTKLIGNFWVDLCRGALYILLPLSFILALLLGSQGVIQNFKPYKAYTLIDSPEVKVESLMSVQRLIPGGPAASQVAIKQIGTNGGGFFNANSAHPFENPTPFSNLLEMLAILTIPAAFCYTFGAMVNDKRQGWAILAAMSLIFIPLTLFGIFQEQNGNPLFFSLGIDSQASHYQPGGNMEGKELRFGITNSALWTAATTAASNGSTNSMLDSYTPLGGMVPLVLMQMGEIVFGGVGSGLYGMLVYILIAVFIAGLMVGRSPEYLGKKIEAFDIKMASLFILIPILTVLLGTAVASYFPAGKSGILNPGPHGFTEILYAFTSAANNNGSAFAGLAANTPFYNTMLGIAMFIGRFWLIIPLLAMAGNMAEKNLVPNSAGTLPTHTFLFIVLLIGIILLIGVLSYVPALVLGPIIEYLNIQGGQ
jgi:potassium-transporting ATPase potassium-binding subunit